jgi:divalent metal cation (Fe/Co/Zn/Cd) transporter
MTVQFLYNIENLFLYTPEILSSIIALILSILSVAVMYFTFLYAIGYMIQRKEKQAIENKKHILEDLILMKDIQSEMEKEIEQATLKATFQS